MGASSGVQLSPFLLAEPSLFLKKQNKAIFNFGVFLCFLGGGWVVFSCKVKCLAPLCTLLYASVGSCIYTLYTVSANSVNWCSVHTKGGVVVFCFFLKKGNAFYFSGCSIALQWCWLLIAIHDWTCCILCLARWGAASPPPPPPWPSWALLF